MEKTLLELPDELLLMVNQMLNFEDRLALAVSSNRSSFCQHHPQLLSLVQLTVEIFSKPASEQNIWQLPIAVSPVTTFSRLVDNKIWYTKILTGGNTASDHVSLKSFPLLDYSVMQARAGANPN